MPWNPWNGHHQKTMCLPAVGHSGNRWLLTLGTGHLEARSPSGECGGKRLLHEVLALLLHVLKPNLCAGAVERHLRGAGILAATKQVGTASPPPAHRHGSAPASGPLPAATTHTTPPPQPHCHQLTSSLATRCTSPRKRAASQATAIRKPSSKMHALRLAMYEFGRMSCSARPLQPQHLAPTSLIRPERTY